MRKKIGLLSILRCQNLWLILILTVLIVIIAYLPVRLAITRMKVPVPQAMLVLGGNPERMEFAAELWRSHRELEIWVSDTPNYLVYNSGFFYRAGVPEQKLHYDGCATDTVTNFTCTVKYFVKGNIRHLYLITSDYHIARSRAIATLILGSRGIVVTPLSVPSKGVPRESRIRTLRDCLRCMVWIVTGKTGASFNPHLQSRTLG